MHFKTCPKKIELFEAERETFVPDGLSPKLDAMFAEVGSFVKFHSPDR